MTEPAHPGSAPGFCPHCGARLAPWARFCPTCGSAVDAPPVAGQASTQSGALPAASKVAAAGRSSAPRPGAKASRPVREALITVGVLLGAVAVVLAVMVARGVPLNLFAAPTLPPAGQIWFGDSYEPATFDLHERWTTVSAGRQMSGVAHTTSDVAANGAKLRIELGGVTIADQVLSNLSGPGDLIGFTFEPPTPGTYTFSIVALDSTLLATGSIAAQ
jgi:hypothetical protein